MDVGSLLQSRKKQESGEDQAIVMERAGELLTESLIIDGHLGTIFDVYHGLRAFEARSQSGHADLPRLIEGRVGCAVLSAFIADRNYPIRGVRAGLEYAEVFRSLGGLEGVKLCMTSTDILEARAQGKVGLILGFEGGEFLDGSIPALRMFYRLGLRVLTLTWNDRNLLGDGAGESRTRGGLTAFGREVVREASRLGIVVDVAHLSEAGFWDVAEMTEVPFVASHANCHALYAHPRNLTDDQLKALAQCGGLVGISFNPGYLGGEENATIATICDHIEHALEVAGEDHVGIGSDFDTFSGPGPDPLAGIDRLQLLVYELLRRGISGKTITKVLGENWLRVFRAVIG